MRVLRRRAPRHRRERERDAGLGSGAASGYAHRPSKVRLSRLRNDRPGAGPGTSDRRRHGDAGAARAGADRQVLRSHAALSSVANLRPARRRSRALDAGRLGRRRLLVAGSPARAAVHECLRLQPSLCRRYAGSGARSGPRAHENRAALGLCARAAAMGRTRAAGGGVPVRADRKAERPASHLERFKGVLHVDGYAGFERLAANGDVVLAACWAHTRRKFYEVAEATGSPIAAEALSRIGELYAVEARVRGQPPARRLAERRSFSRAIVEALRDWLETQLSRVSGRSALAEAIRYALCRWEGLTRFLQDWRIELDTNPVERAIRPVALGRKNHLFAGSDGGGERWAIVCTLAETAKLNGVEPYAYLVDVLQRMADGHPVNRLDELLPWVWQLGNPVKS